MRFVQGKLLVKSIELCAKLYANSSAVLKVFGALAQTVTVAPPPASIKGESKIFLRGSYRFMASARVPTRRSGAAPLVESKGKAPGEGLGGEAPKADSYFH